MGRKKKTDVLRIEMKMQDQLSLMAENVPKLVLTEWPEVGALVSYKKGQWVSCGSIILPRIWSCSSLIWVHRDVMSELHYALFFLIVRHSEFWGQNS